MVVSWLPDDKRNYSAALQCVQKVFRLLDLLPILFCYSLIQWIKLFSPLINLHTNLFLLCHYGVLCVD
jgi:hypothetical protein